MRGKVLLAALVAAVTLASPRAARADFKSWKGETPPEISSATQVQGDRVTDLKSLRGRLVALQFFATW